MHYNESIIPKLSRNPQAKRSSHCLSTFASKKSSTTFNQSFHHPSQSRFKNSQSRQSID